MPALTLLLLLACAISAAAAEPGPRPNILLVITDDQGFGDLGVHGNEKIRTPNLDRLAQESVRLTRFHVSPVCSPTRASLLTGRYNYRTGVVDTYLGRSLMHADERTLAEVLGAAGYRCGLFGKWHLGDNYPLRAMDQGFHEVLIGRGGGLAQPSDPPGTDPKTAYFDPALWHNGQLEKRAGYCTDIFADATMRFIEESHGRGPFFAMLATNAPHDPLQVPEADLQPYLGLGLDEKTARVYAMVTNLDRNVGRVLTKLEALGVARDTIVVFLTDNGPQWPRFNAGMRATKGTIYEGGIRVPCFIRPVGGLPGRDIDLLTAHIDLLPTLLAACDIAPPAGVKMDGMDFSALLRGGKMEAVDRTVHLQWHRGDAPELFRASCALTQRWKLVNGRELYDLRADPAEKTNVAAEHPEVVEKLRAEHEAWFRDVTARCAENPAEIVIGTPHENPTLLSRQDWRGPRAGWLPESLGHWEIEAAAAGVYDVRLLFPPAAIEREARLRIGALEQRQPIGATADVCTFTGVRLGAGKSRLEPSLETGGTSVGPHYVELRRVE